MNGELYHNSLIINRISSSVMSAVNEKRIRAVPLGTVGGRTGRQ